LHCSSSSCRVGLALQVEAPGRLAFAGNVHEVNGRIIKDEVIVQGGDFQAACKRSIHCRRDADPSSTTSLSSIPVRFSLAGDRQDCQMPLAISLASANGPRLIVGI